VWGRENKRMAEERPAKKAKLDGAIRFKAKARQFQIPENFPEPVSLKEWNPESKDHQLPPHFFIVLEGSRRIGKSIFLKWLLYYYRDAFDLAIVITETSFNGFWQPIVGNKWVHHGWKPLLVQLLLQSQEEELRKEIYSNGRYKKRRVLLILDDIIGDKAHIHEDTMLNTLAVEGRHSGISVALTTQDAKAINPTLRNNADVAIIFQQKNWRAKEAIWRDFINLFPNRKSAEEVMMKYTMDHDCIVVENCKLSQEPVKLYFHVAGKKTFDESKINPKGEKGDSRCPPYTLGSAEQKRLAQTEKGKLPLFPGMKA
jgi:hypothetical protein